MAELQDVVNAIEDTNSSLNLINDNLILINDNLILMNGNVLILKDNDVLYQQGAGVFYLGLNERIDAFKLKYDDDEELYTRSEMKEVNMKYYEQLEDMRALQMYNFVFFGVIVAALIVLIISGIFKRV